MFCAGYKGPVTQNALCNMHTVVVSINIRSWKEMSLFPNARSENPLWNMNAVPLPATSKGLRSTNNDRNVRSYESTASTTLLFSLNYNSRDVVFGSEL